MTKTYASTWSVGRRPLLEENSVWGKRCVVVPPHNIYGATFGDDCRIGPFVEIQRGVTVGSRVKIGSHTFICRGVTIEDEVFIGHGVMFCNDTHPVGVNEDGSLKGDDDWECVPTHVGRRASIGTGAVILPGCDIGRGAMVGAGAVVTKMVPPGETVYGNPARRK